MKGGKVLSYRAGHYQRAYQAELAIWGNKYRDNPTLQLAILGE